MQNCNSKFKIDLKSKCYQFGLKIILLTNEFPNKRSAWVISDQLIRASTSIGANLFEGTAASSRLEFKKYYEIALKSANETKYWLSLTEDSGLVLKEKTLPLVLEVTEISRMLAKSVLTLKKLT